jgi:predicted naringenin-chalcone synthase
LVDVYLNKIATAVPPHDVHKEFSDFAPTLLAEERRAGVFKKMADRSHIDHRYSFLKARRHDEYLDDAHFYKLGAFPDTQKRMQFYEEHAFDLAKLALDQLEFAKLDKDITHVIVTSCTGFYAPGLDLQIVEHYGLKASTERTIIGFMGCYAAFNSLKLAWHVVRSMPTANVLILNLELCTIHLQETDNIEELLSFLIFADGCAASLVSADPHGIRLDRFTSTIAPGTKEQITWDIGNEGFDMVLSGKVPGTIAHALPASQKDILGDHNLKDIDYWAIHPGGRTVLDAVQKSFSLKDEAMVFSREVLKAYGNMSSATVMFVLKDILESKTPAGTGCAMAFGPGVTLESLLFYKSDH